MLLEVTSDHVELVQAISTALRATAKKPIIPSHGQLKISASKDDLRVTGCRTGGGGGDEPGASYIEAKTIAIMCATPGEITVSAKTLEALIKRFPGGSSDVREVINLKSKDGKKLTISSKSAGEYEIPCGDVSEYPDIQWPKSDSPCRIEASDYVGLEQRSAFAAGKQQTTYALDAVCLQLRSGRLEAAGTDSRRLSVCSVGVGADNEYRINVPAEWFRMSSKTVSRLDDNHPVDLIADDRMVMLSCESFKMATNTLVRPFPRYEELIPSERGVSDLVKVKASDLRSSIWRLEALTDDDNPIVKIHTQDDGLRLEVDSSNGAGESSVEAEVDQKSGREIQINPAYILDALQRARSEEIEMWLPVDDDGNPDSSQPLFIILDHQTTYMAMPIT